VRTRGNTKMIRVVLLIIFSALKRDLEKFKRIIRSARGKVFVSSDSKSTMSDIKKEFGEKIVSIDSEFAMIMDQDNEDRLKTSDYHQTFLEILFTE
jgi:hypothetical protein